MNHISSQQYLETSSEAKDQIALVELLDRIKYNGRPLWYTAIPNGGKRDKRTAAILKLMGVKPGVMDLLIFDTPPSYPISKGAALELKRLKGGITSPEQLDWLDYFNNNSWIARVVNGIDEALEFLNECGYI
jgi:hypothetical protein